MTTDRQESPATEPVSLTALWFSALGGPIAWILHNLLSYGLSTNFCIPGQILLLHLVTLVTALIALASALVGWRSLNRVKKAEGQGDRISKQRARQMAYYGLLSGLFFLLVIIAEGIPNFFLDPCLRVG